jgi:hypothetical protein
MCKVKIHLFMGTLVPCYTISSKNLTPAQVRAYVIADNKLAENAGWDRKRKIQGNRRLQPRFADCLVSQAVRQQ